jgi:virulence-associated protein VapD
MTVLDRIKTPLADKIEGSYAGLMYAIAFDMDTAVLDALYPEPNGYKQIEAILVEFGFGRKQGSVYYGDDSVTLVTVALAAVSDIRVLQLLNNDDLKPLL